MSSGTGSNSGASTTESTPNNMVAVQSHESIETSLVSFKKDLVKMATRNIKKKTIEVGEQLDRLLNERF